MKKKKKAFQGPSLSPPAKGVETTTTKRRVFRRSRCVGQAIKTKKANTNHSQDNRASIVRLQSNASIIRDVRHPIPPTKWSEVSLRHGREPSTSSREQLPSHPSFRFSLHYSVGSASMVVGMMIFRSHPAAPSVMVRHHFATPGEQKPHQTAKHIYSSSSHHWIAPVQTDRKKHSTP